MTPQQAKELLPIITAFAEGKTIQVKAHNARIWVTLEGLNFNGNPKEYRIKPEPREFWVNVYSSKHDYTAYTVHDTKEAANEMALNSRTECIKVREVID